MATGDAPTPILRVQALEAGYPPARPRVLAGVTCELHPATITALIGPNGAGKTTLLRAMLGLIPPATGQVHLAGEAAPVHMLPPKLRAPRLAYIAQRPSVAFAYSVREVVELAGLLLGVGILRRREAATQALADVGLLDRANDTFGELSIGQQQGVALARALAQLRLANRPMQALLADEPFSAMDPARMLGAMQELRRCADEGRAVACVLHDVALARRWADQVVLLTHDGRVAAAGTAREVCTPEVLGPVYGVAFAAGVVATPLGDLPTLTPSHVEPR